LYTGSVGQKVTAAAWVQADWQQNERADTETGRRKCFTVAAYLVK